MYLSTAPYLSFAGAHLPRLKVPIPLHLLFGRRVAVLDLPVAGAARAVDAPRAGHENSFIKLAPAGRSQARRPARAGPRPAAAGPDRRRRLHRRRRGPAPDRDVPQAAGPLARWLRDSPLTQDVVIGNVEYALRKPCSIAESARWPIRLRLRRCLPARWPTSTDFVRTIAGRSKRSTGACSALTRPRPAGCAGIGSTAATRTTRAAAR